MLPKESILNLEPYSAPDEGRMGYVRLDFNENLQGPSPKVIEAMKKITLEECGCYPEYGVFKKTLARFLGLSEKNVIPSNGSDEAIKVIFDAYVEKGDEVILLTPGYGMYKLYAQIAGAKIVTVPFGSDYSFPKQGVLDAITTKTRLIVLINPNNPTGTLIAREDIQRIIEASPKIGVLIDEAYAPFAKVTNIDLSVKYENVFVLQTFSKAYGLAGLRIGYLASAERNIDTIAKVLSPSYSVDRFAMAAATAAMEDTDYVDRYVEEVLKVREEFVEEMESLGFSCVPSFGNFVLVDFEGLSKDVFSALEQKKILVRPRSEERLKNFLRISIGTKEQMQQVIAVLRPFSKKLVSMKPALIFDMDGVLVDESGSYRLCIQKTAEDFLGRSIERSLVEEFKRKGGYNNDYDCVQAILSSEGVDVCLKEVMKKFDAYYEDFKIYESWLLDESLLTNIKKRFRLGIFTGRPKRDAIDALKRFNKEAYFEVVVTDDDVKNRKPDPEGLILACQLLGVKEAVYIGDTKDDALAAERASVRFIGVVPPGGSKDNFKPLKISTFLEDISKIEEALCQKEM